MHYSVMKFFTSVFDLKDIRGKRVLDVGAFNVNGSLRDIIRPTMYPKEYIGVDITNGPYVDFIVPSESLISYFGRNSFDVIICTEMLEHCEQWKVTIYNMKSLLKSDGKLFLTTRSKGFPLHNYPYDYWRFEVDDMEKIFSDMKSYIVTDPQDPGVFIYAQKLDNFCCNDLTDITIYSMVQS